MPTRRRHPFHEEHHDDEFDQRLGYDGQRSDSQLYGEREGKREYDKRQSIAARDADREAQRALEEALDHILKHAGVWSATGAEILDAWLAQQA